ncbi:MAG TPA: pirin family protein [Rhizomicrobium sp.]|nr:pirin family protein [Rhizomicrobium sp.]
MLTLRKSEDRGKTRIDWLDSRHSFSFGDYRDPDHAGFGPLRVINEDWIGGGGGFHPHPHRDMEIVTYMLDGALEHRDSLGHGGIIRPGEIQRMSAGRGIVHAEFNASRSETAHLLQIWIVPSKAGLDPSYEQKAIDPQSVRNRLSRIAAPDPRASEVRLVQDAEIWAAKLAPDEEVVHRLEPGRRAWLQVAGGEVTAGPRRLKAGDALGVTDEAALAVRAHAPSEILLFDMA